MPEFCTIGALIIACNQVFTVPMFVNPVIAFFIALLLVIPFIRLIGRIIEILPG